MRQFGMNDRYVTNINTHDCQGAWDTNAFPKRKRKDTWESKPPHDNLRSVMARKRNMADENNRSSQQLTIFWVI